MKPIKLKTTFFYALIPILFVFYTIVAWINISALTMAIVYASFALAALMIFSAWVWNRESYSRVFKIKAGHHYPSGFNFQLPTYKTRYVVAYVIVYNDFLYSVKSTDDQRMLDQISKVGGHAWGGSHINSVRLGVNHESQSGTKTFFSYIYVDGKRRLDDTTGREPVLYREVRENAFPVEYKIVIKADEERRMLTIDLYDALTNKLLGTRNEHSVDVKDFSKHGYIQHPYIGGEVPLTHGASMKWQLAKLSTVIPTI